MRAHLSFANELSREIAGGTLLPGWSNEFDGLGSLGIRLYPPLSSYVTLLIQKIIGDWYVTVIIYYFIWTAVGCWGCFLFVEEYANRKFALLAAFLAAIAPFPLIEIYRFSLYSQFAAAAAVPFCFYFCARVIDHQKWRDVIWLSTSLSVVFLTHIPTAIFTGLTLFAYSILIVINKLSLQRVVMLVSSISLAISATAFYWVRLVSELGWIAHNGSEYRTGIYNYRHWLFPSSIGADMPVLMFLYKRIDVLVLLQFALLIPAVLVLLLKGRRALRNCSVMFGLSVCSFLSLFMISRPAAIVWEHFDVLQKTQFPWRWLAVVSPLAIIAFTLGIAELRILRPDRKTLWTSVTFLAISLFLAYNIRLTFNDLRSSTRLEFEQNFTPENSPLGLDHQMWWPIWAKSEALDQAGHIDAGDRAVDTYQWGTSKRRFTIGAGRPTDVRVPTFYYPYWKAVVNDDPVSVRPDEFGLILIPVGEKRADIQLSFEEPTKNRIALALSLAAWAAIMLGGFRAGFRRLQNTKRPRISTSVLQG